MQHADELLIRIDSKGNIYVEDTEDGIKSYKRIQPDTLIHCVKNSIRMMGVSSGVLPQGTFSFSAGEDGTKKVFMEFPSRRCDITYEKTEYKNFPLPRLVFGFEVKKERICSVYLGVVEEGMLKPTSKMFIYPFSNVGGFRVCCGGNTLPSIKSLHQLAGVMFYVMSMPNNNDHYTRSRTKLKMELRELFENLKDKDPGYYYTDVLCDEGKTLQDFINQ